MRIRHRVVLIGLLAMLAVPAPAADKPAAGAEARAAALAGFQGDLVSVLALRAGAQPLLGAALLARSLPKPGKFTSFHALIDRAAAAEDAGPAVQWARLADCDAQGDACPNASALRKLTGQAADNAAVWLLKFDLDTRDMKSAAARADLAHAAAAKLYDDYAGTSAAALAAVVDALPPPAAAQNAAGASGVQALLVLGNARLQVRPMLPVVAQLCDHAQFDAAIKADCLKLGQLLSWGSSPLARSLGLHLIETLGDPAAQADARRQRRDLAWQVHNHAQLALRVPDDAALAAQWLGIARQGGSEMSQWLAALRAAGISTTAPGSWQPAGATGREPSP
jgi:hypothetical protein